MPERLRKYINQGLENKGLQKKHLVLDLTNSKSQYYRFINAEARPPQEFVEQLVEKLDLDVDVFWQLFTEVEATVLKENIRKSEALPHKEHQFEPVRANFALRGVSNFLMDTTNAKDKTTTVLKFSALLIGGFWFYGQLQNGAGESAPTIVMDNVALFPRINGDNSLFIRDVTIADGSPIPMDTWYEKVWRIKNTGKVTWQDRYLQRITPIKNSLCKSPVKVPIAKTLPGHEVDIKVKFLTQKWPGSCRTDWKMVDNEGELYFPNLYGLMSIVHVMEPKAVTGLPASIDDQHKRAGSGKGFDVGVGK